jgi:hypothetical protein
MQKLVEGLAFFRFHSPAKLVSLRAAMLNRIETMIDGLPGS